MSSWRGQIASILVLRAGEVLDPGKSMSSGAESHINRSRWSNEPSKDCEDSEARTMAQPNLRFASSINR